MKRHFRLRTSSVAKLAVFALIAGVMLIKPSLLFATTGDTSGSCDLGCREAIQQLLDSFGSQPQ
ncbi:MAG: hypothetical protein U1A27_03000 [Phycisphaerae bacterium]